MAEPRSGPSWPLEGGGAVEYRTRHVPSTDSDWAGLGVGLRSSKARVKESMCVIWDSVAVMPLLVPDAASRMARFFSSSSSMVVSSVDGGEVSVGCLGCRPLAKSADVLAQELVRVFTSANGI